MSKRELYALFPSKDKILFACIAERASAISGGISELPEPDTAPELFSVLREFGFILLKDVTRADVLPAFRFAIARSGDPPEVARVIDRNGRRASHAALAKLIDHAVSRGLLKPSEADGAGLLGTFVVRSSGGASFRSCPAEDQMKLLSEQAAREFLAIYSIKIGYLTRIGASVRPRRMFRSVY